MPGVLARSGLAESTFVEIVQNYFFVIETTNHLGIKELPFDHVLFRVLVGLSWPRDRRVSISGLS